MAKARLKAPAAPRGLQSREEVTLAILTIGRATRERTRIEAAMNDRIAAIKAQAEAEAEIWSRVIKQHVVDVQLWCEAHRDELTGNGRTKTANLGSGEVAWRMSPKKVVLKGMEAVIALLRERGLPRFIRTKEEVNKEAILLEPEAVRGLPGIKIEQAEEFVITPFEAKLEEAA
jgi:phage host-nuclease inhibitor protein Gam